MRDRNKQSTGSNDASLSGMRRHGERRRALRELQGRGSDRIETMPACPDTTGASLHRSLEIYADKQCSPDSWRVSGPVSGVHTGSPVPLRPRGTEIERKGEIE